MCPSSHMWISLGYTLDSYELSSTADDTANWLNHCREHLAIASKASTLDRTLGDFLWKSTFPFDDFTKISNTFYGGSSVIKLWIPDLIFTVHCCVNHLSPCCRWWNQCSVLINDLSKVTKLLSDDPEDRSEALCFCNLKVRFLSFTSFSHFHFFFGN